jgi:hypothetical protein
MHHHLTIVRTVQRHLLPQRWNTAARSRINMMLRVGRVFVRLVWQSNFTDNNPYWSVLCIALLLGAGIIAKIGAPIHP